MPAYFDAALAAEGNGVRAESLHHVAHDVVRIEEFEGRLACSVVAAGQLDMLEIEVAPLELFHHHPRKLRREGQVILGVNHQRLFRIAREFIYIRSRADGGPCAPQIVKIDGRFPAGAQSTINLENLRRAWTAI